MLTVDNETGGAFTVLVQGDGLLGAARVCFPNKAQAAAFIRLLGPLAEFTLLERERAEPPFAPMYKELEKSKGWDALVARKVAKLAADIPEA